MLPTRGGTLADDIQAIAVVTMGKGGGASSTISFERVDGEVMPKVSGADPYPMERPVGDEPEPDDSEPEEDITLQHAAVISSPHEEAAGGGAIQFTFDGEMDWEEFDSRAALHWASEWSGEVNDPTMPVSCPAGKPLKCKAVVEEERLVAEAKQANMTVDAYVAAGHGGEAALSYCRHRLGSLLQGSIGGRNATITLRSVYRTLRAWSQPKWSDGRMRAPRQGGERMAWRGGTCGAEGP